MVGGCIVAANGKNGQTASALDTAGTDRIEPSVTQIEARQGWQLINARDLWRYRELLYFLTLRDVKVRYKQTVLGAAWAVLQPFATMVVFCLFMGRLAGANTEVPYPLFVFSGMLAWSFFANAISAAGASLVNNQSLVTKVYLPRLIIPFSAASASIVDLAIGFGMLVFLMIYYGVGTSVSIVLLPLVLGSLMVTILGVGTIVAALTVAYRDVRHVMPFMLQLWMFATPSIYMAVDNDMGQAWRFLLLLNPANGLVLTFRQAVLGSAVDPVALTAASTVGVILLIVGCLYFRRVEKSFADII